MIRKCAAVFRKDHVQTNSQSAVTIQPNLIALQGAARFGGPGGGIVRSKLGLAA